MNLKIDVGEQQTQSYPAGDYQIIKQEIRAIQIMRADEPCFGTSKRYTCTDICEWSRECRRLVAQWKQ